jgi:hypothetical protein
LNEQKVNDDDDPDLNQATQQQREGGPGLDMNAEFELRDRQLGVSLIW